MQPKTKLDLNNIRIAFPCPVRWEDMHGDERVRDCGSCNLQVFNTSELTERQIEELIRSKSNERLCIRLHKRADGTLLTKNCPVGFRAYAQRAARFAGASLSVILGLVSIGFSQNKNSIPDEKTTISVAKQKKIIVDGVVTDSNKAIIPDATIKLFSSNGKKLISRTKTDGYGDFKLSLPKPGKYILKFSSDGFAEKIVEINLKSSESINVVLEVEIVGEVVGIFVSEPLIDMTSSEISTTIKPNPFD